MAKLTLLELVNSVLNEANSDPVNSINDTNEALQIAKLFKDLYFDFITDNNLHTDKTLFQLTGLGDTTKPTRMQIPESIKQVLWLKYDVREDVSDPLEFVQIDYVDPETFIETQNRLDNSATNVVSCTEGGVTYFVTNDMRPRCYTSFDDEYVVFDSYDSDVDSTLQSSKTQCYGLREPTFTMSDSFTPSLPADYFPAFLAAGKAVAYEVTKQQPSQLNISKARRHGIKIKSDGTRATDYEPQRNNFGR